MFVLSTLHLGIMRFTVLLFFCQLNIVDQRNKMALKCKHRHFIKKQFLLWFCVNVLHMLYMFILILFYILFQCFFCVFDLILCFKVREMVYYCSTFCVVCVCHIIVKFTYLLTYLLTLRWPLDPCRQPKVCEIVFYCLVHVVNVYTWRQSVWGHCLLVKCFSLDIL